MTKAKDPVVVLITSPEEQAGPIAEAIVRHRLAACVNIIPGVRSLYWWQGSVQDGVESLLIAKTTADLVGALTEIMATVHPYENFELVALPIAAGSPAYLEWIAASTGPGA